VTVVSTGAEGRSSERIVECRGVTKRFGGTVALDRVSVDIVSGTVHALVGENGAGKSTLGKVIAGIHQPDAGEVAVDGAAVSLRSPKDALDLGIAMVAQELSLLPTRSVLDNVLLGMEPNRRGVLDRTAARARFDDVAERFGIDLDPSRLVGSLSIAEQQRVEIMRGLARNARVLIMDEPTARLSHREAAGLSENLRELANRGVAVIYVSHFLEEVLGLSDRLTVLRNGQVIRTSDTADEDRTTLVEGIAGRRLDAAYPARVAAAPDANVVLKVDRLTRAGEFSDVSFEVRAGEIVTLAGLVGAGRSEVVRTIFGAHQPDSGDMFIDGAPHAPSGPHEAIASDVAMIPEARRTQGLLMARTVSDNVSLPHMSRFARNGVVNRSEEGSAVSRVVDQVGLTGASVDSPMYTLSGGNQQKSLFARSLVADPRLLIADEPTRGVDVGAKRAIYDLIVEMAAAGAAILAVSSEIDEVLGISHRIIVMRDGRIADELSAATATDEQLMALAFGLNQGASAQ
jgi:simple sugar transport system ATP-binding protein/ribose transport system ATP-binding protein